MRKKLFVCLMLMMCILAQAVPVGAAGVGISSLPGPPEGAKLISSYDIDDSGFNTVIDGFATCTYMYDNSSKVVAYSSETKLYYCNTLSTFDIVWEDGSVHQEEAVLVKSYSSYTEALQSSVEYTVGDELSVPVAPGSYLVFVSGSGDFRCESSSLVDYVYDREAGNKPFDPSLVPKLSLSVVEYLKTGDTVTGAKLRLTYDLPGYNWNGQLKTENASTVYAPFLSSGVPIESSSARGSVDFIADGLSNGTYDVELWTDAGNRYHVDFVVDFIAGLDFNKYTGSFDSPVITILGLPSDTSTFVQAPIKLVVKSDIPVTLSWDGYAVSDVPSCEFEVDVYENKTYRYVAVSEVGVATSGEAVITNLDVMPGMAGSDLVESTGLVQTGIERDSVGSYFAVIALASVTLIVVGFVVYRKVGVGNK